MSDLRTYAVVTASYWGFTLTDGALRMLVLLHFHTLGFTPFQLALLFLLYEVTGMTTTLLGGWLGTRFGVNITLHAGLALQVVALLALSVLQPDWPSDLSVLYVLLVQGLSGIAKDLAKTSAKSAIRLVVPDNSHSRLFRWVALLTGSKNALKGVGFFLGGLLLAVAGFTHALWLMAACLACVLVASLTMVPSGLGRVRSKVRASEILSRSRAVTLLSAARLFLFAARDVWFVVGLPVWLYEVAGWSFTAVGGVLALWVIGYGMVQAGVPTVIASSRDGRSGEIRAARSWILVLTGVTAALAAGYHAGNPSPWFLIAGLGVFGACFAVNSSLHSYLLLALAGSKEVAMSVGFYYSANAAGRLVGTLLSGLAYQWGGLVGCLAGATVLLALAAGFTMVLGAIGQPGSPDDASEPVR